ncbi:nucleotidyltransferase [Effusibacillus lacus]|uniref:tRNA(Met) cytidine acetate ligase n=1 Tax=Effusibacillus lacus TaxID=1348429 RepID=A0A292YND5_9BACL|nr:nucleotidyltransferase [Effusibacillus lacus]TCS76575.1 putative nucleotidyltransferase [Effusibacillus lacus]GAX90409.1 nucleotidyltransferase [Effusibacillus lacus]
MLAAGVVVEYNPMHNGHCYHLQKTKEVTGADALVAVMSGHFLQRGEPAVINKWARTEMALRNGVDLVLELPVVYSTQSARLFAFGAVATLHSLGTVGSICFGSEHGDLDSLLELSEIIASPPLALQTELESSLEQGLAYPAAFAGALKRYVSQTGVVKPDLVNHPNNMLGLEYLHALRKLNSPIRAFTIKRIASGYRDLTLHHSEIASATAIRKAIAENRKMDAYLPTSNLAILQKEFEQGRGPVTWDCFTQPLFSLIARSTPDELRTYAHFDQEGLAERVANALPNASSVTDLVYKVKTRRYTWTRIQRALTALLLGLRREQLDSMDLEKGPDSIRVLGFTEKGRALLKESASVASLPIFTNISRNVPAMMEANLRATALYSLGYPCREASNRGNETQKPVIFIKEDSSDIQ